MVDGILTFCCFCDHVYQCDRAFHGTSTLRSHLLYHCLVVRSQTMRSKGSFLYKMSMSRFLSTIRLLAIHEDGYKEKGGGRRAQGRSAASDPDSDLPTSLDAPTRRGRTSISKRVTHDSGCQLILRVTPSGKYASSSCHVYAFSCLLQGRAGSWQSITSIYKIAVELLLIIMDEYLLVS